MFVLKRNLKKFVALFLILCFITPCYASLSASDGSAFVTKGEFDSAMTDFNSRLTTFEAGINSKIDSQVSSFLDRNGIWSGATQTLINATRDVNMPACAVSGGSGSVSSKVFEKVLIEKCSKPGMVFIKWYYVAKNTPGTGRSGMIGYFFNAKNYGISGADAGSSLYINFTCAQPNVTQVQKCSLKIFSDIGFVDRSPYDWTSVLRATVYRFPKNKVYTTSEFFVAKNDIVQWNASAQAKFGNTASVDLIDNNRLRCVVEEVKIY